MTQRATIIRGGRLINPGGQRAEAADILIDGDTIAAVGAAGLPAPAGAIAIDARERLLHPGLINAHMHGHGNLAKGMGDRWTLELLLAAGPWITGSRPLEGRQDGFVTSNCVSCGACVKECPTGALTEKTVLRPSRPPSPSSGDCGSSSIARASLRSGRGSACIAARLAWATSEARRISPTPPSATR